MTSQLDDFRLIREYVELGSDAAFAALVERYIGLVHSTAMRQVGDADLARDITQTTFIILAKKAPAFNEGTILPGWLYRTAQYAAASALRTEHRRREREKEAMDIQTNDQTESAWEKLAPLLDQAMARLSATDRNAVLLRYFENKTSREVALTLGVNESTAQKRVARAVEKLRVFCHKRGVILPAAVITAVISAHSVQAAPAGLAVSTVSLVNGGIWAGTTSALVKATLKYLAWAKYKMALSAALGLLVVSGSIMFLERDDLFPARYQGQPVGKWLEQLDDHDQEHPFVLTWKHREPPESLAAQQSAAADAIHGLDAQAIPDLIAKLARDDSGIYHFLHRYSLPAEQQRHQAALAFETLGPAGKPYLSQLSRVLYNCRCAKEPARALAAIGPEGWEVLTRAISDTNEDLAGCCIWALGCRRAYVPGTVEKLKGFLVRDGKTSLTGLSAWALAEIGEDREEVIPLLVKDLDSGRPDTRWSCAIALGHMGRDAQSAVPALLAHLNDSDVHVRHDLAQALEQIDPAAAARAGVAGALASEHVPRTYLGL